MPGPAAIRRCTDADRPALLELFERAGQGSPTEALWGDTASEAEIYLTAYLDHPGGSILLAEVDGRLVGYLAGSLGDPGFPSEDDRMERAIRDHGLLRRPAAIGFFLRAGLDSVRARWRRLGSAAELDDPRWPAHLHINVAPEARGTGAADALMETWLGMVAAAGVPGTYLQTLVENERAVRFFTRMGFVPHGPTPPVPGIRSRGRRLHQATMVLPAPDAP